MSEDLKPDEIISSLFECRCEQRYSIEPHGDGYAIYKVHLPPLPDKISWVVNFKDGMAKRFSYPVNGHGVVTEKNSEIA